MNTLTNVKKSQGIMMFIILLLSYIVFASNWVAGSNLSEKIVYHYFNGEQVSPMVSEVINYTITIARIFVYFIEIKSAKGKYCSISITLFFFCCCICYKLLAIYYCAYDYGIRRFYDNGIYEYCSS